MREGIGFSVVLLIEAVALLCFSAAPTAATGAEAKPFGIAGFSLQTTQDGPGLVNQPYRFTQAGGHPYALTSKLEFSSEETSTGLVLPTRDPNDVFIDLPAGLIADPQAAPRCSTAQAAGGEPCPTDTQVGVFVLHFAFEGASVAVLGPIVNVKPESGQAAELGLETPRKTTLLLTGRVVRTAQGYALAIVASGIPALGVVSMETTLWGVPAAEAHDPQRGLYCLAIAPSPEWLCQGGGVASSQEPVAFLTMGGDCSAGPPTGVVWASSWEEPGRYARAQSTLPGLTDCNRLPFSPDVVVRPETPLADEPVGLGVGIRVGQTEGSISPAPPQLRDATVTLPQGVTINPSVADGVQACGPTGPEGIDIPTGMNARGEPLEPGEVGEGEELGPSGEPQLAPGHCAEASTIGTAQASTPLLSRPLEGRVYLASPGCGGPGRGPCTAQDAVDGNLYRVYVELGGNAEHPDEGVTIKIEGQVQANPATGQLTVKLTENPQLPLGELSIHLFGGPRALLANPTTCGPATTTSDLEPWSAPDTADAAPSSFYEVTGCVDPSALNPGFLAGSVDASAGAFSPFTLTVTRGDREPYLSQIQLHAPPGLSAMLSSVPLCEDSQASAGKCPGASRVGSSLVAAGAGSQPLSMPGDMYLSGPYEGAPFGLVIVTSAQAGPLSLGFVVTRARIDIDPQTAALTITSDPLPQIVLGVPLRIQRVTLDIDRPDFVFNPTSCEAQRVTATIVGALDASARVANGFALGGCERLTFKPVLTASTSAHTSYTGGASLDMKVAFPHAARGASANLARIEIALPKQLPSRLTTLQSACPGTTFETDPAACPKASVVGLARAQTPVLSTPLTGPVYIVSHGPNLFPSPIVVLQGDGVRLNLTGSTVIDDAGTARVAFDGAPDVPIGSLELYLPQGPHSMLTANTSLCALAKTITVERHIVKRAHGRIVHHTVKLRKRLRASLPMPTQLVAQNGAVVRRNATIDVTGCAAHKAKAARRSPAPTG